MGACDDGPIPQPCSAYNPPHEHNQTAAWALQDYPDPTQQPPVVADGYTSASALLSEQAMEDAIYTALNPTVATAAALYPSLVGVTKAQKKAFAKFIKFYVRDQVGVFVLVVVWMEWKRTHDEHPTTLSRPAAPARSHLGHTYITHTTIPTKPQADFPTKLRCIFHWAERPPEPQVATPPPVPPPKVIDLL